jgi:hypothetical protein
MARTITIPTARVSDAMAAYTIGFAKLEVHDRVEDAVGAGSGTLVSVGKVRGILTAAHVLTNLPDQGEVGIVEYRGQNIHYVSGHLRDLQSMEPIYLSSLNHCIWFHRTFSPRRLDAFRNRESLCRGRPRIVDRPHSRPHRDNARNFHPRDPHGASSRPLDATSQRFRHTRSRPRVARLCSSFKANDAAQ